jgi:hypothetical protein
MYNYVATINPLEKRAEFATVVGASGTLTYSSATYVLTGNDGSTIASGSVDGHDAADTLTVRVWKILNAVSIPLPVGCSILDLVTNTTSSDSVNPTFQTRILLYVPGTVSRTLYPTGADVLVEMVARGLVLANPTAIQQYFDLETAASVGRRRFEELTGRKYLGVSQTRTFDYPTGTRTLKLRQDLCALTSLSVGGTAKVLNTDFYLKPDNADLDGRPWDRIEFAYDYAYVNPARAISIVGTWGFGTTIVEDAWSAMRDIGCMECIPAVSAALTGGLVSWTTGGTTENYGTKPFAGAIEMWQARIDQAIKYRTRVGTGITG